MNRDVYEKTLLESGIISDISEIEYNEMEIEWLPTWFHKIVDNPKYGNEIWYWGSLGNGTEIISLTLDNPKFQIVNIREIDTQYDG